jgi:hypothetical protein
MAVMGQATGGTAANPESLHAELKSRMTQYIDDLNNLNMVCNMQFQISESTPITESYARLQSDKIKMVEESMKSLDFRWNTFTQAMQMDIVDDEELMDQMTQVQLLKQTVTDSINSKRQQCQALMEYVRAEDLLFSKDSTYKHLYKMAFQLSLIKKTAPKLEKLKAKEQALFGNLQASYEKAKAAAALIPALSKSMKVLDDIFANYKVMSEKIQAMEYKPFIQRIKDYLIGLACVAILILFFNLLLTKLKSAQKARQTLKQYQNAMNQQGGGTYPTI